MADAGERKKSPLVSLGVEKALTDEIERFIRQHPEFGIRFRSDFFNRAAEHYLRFLRREVLVRNAVENLNQDTPGKPGPLESLRRMGVKLSDGAGE